MNTGRHSRRMICAGNFWDKKIRIRSPAEGGRLRGFGGPLLKEGPGPSCDKCYFVSLYPEMNVNSKSFAIDNLLRTRIWACVPGIHYRSRFHGQVAIPAIRRSSEGYSQLRQLSLETGFRIESVKIAAIGAPVCDQTSTFQRQNQYQVLRSLHVKFRGSIVDLSQLVG